MRVTIRFARGQVRKKSKVNEPIRHFVRPYTNGIIRTQVAVKAVILLIKQCAHAVARILLHPVLFPVGHLVVRHGFLAGGAWYWVLLLQVAVSVCWETLQRLERPPWRAENRVGLATHQLASAWVCPSSHHFSLSRLLFRQRRCRYYVS